MVRCVRYIVGVDAESDLHPLFDTERTRNGRIQIGQSRTYRAIGPASAETAGAGRCERRLVVPLVDVPKMDRLREAVAKLR